MSLKFTNNLLAATAVLVVPCVGVHAQQAKNPVVASPASDGADIVVTGSRIPRRELENVSPVSVTSGEQLKLERAATVEDFSRNLPQLAGGANASSVSSDSHGAQTLDLRNLGENRTLVLIDGTRAVPFSFRNSVDVSAIPAALLKRVDVLTGGAAAVYGADAVAGVVNFVMDSDYKGLALTANLKDVVGGGSQYGGNATFGTSLGDRGHVTGYVEYTQRDALTAGSRPYATQGSVPIAGAGGNYTDVSSGRKFSFDDTGKFTTTPQTTNYASQFLLISPMKRFNADLFYKYDLTDKIQAYGRLMHSTVKTVESTLSGSQPIVINETVNISSTNPYLTQQVRDQLTFVNGVAKVTVNRSLSEVGILTDSTERNTTQGQFGLRGPVAPNIKWDAYLQYGYVSELTTQNQGRNTTTLQSIVDTVNIFGPGDQGLKALSSSFVQSDRKRSQLDGGATVSGSSTDWFKLHSGPIGFAVGYQYRSDKGKDKEANTAEFQGNLRSHEGYGELTVPLISDLPIIRKLQFEGAYRVSNYTKTGSNGSGTIGTYPTMKIGGIWEVTRDLVFRGSYQTVVRVPNFGELDGALASLPFSRLRTVARLTPRYTGDPCALGTGNAAQCTSLGYKGSYDSLDPANLVGNYYYGGNADLKPEKGNTLTVGGALTPRFAPGFSATVDFYKINLNGATGVIQPVSALTSCYITDPTPGNPLCKLVTRDPVTGYILDAYVNDQNLGFIKQQGVDFNVRYVHALPQGLPGKQVGFRYQGNLVTSYTLQQNSTVQPINCRGTYGARCSADGVSQVAASYKHYATFDWKFDLATAQLGWRHIGGLRDSTLNSTGTIPAYDYFNLSVSLKPRKNLIVNLGLNNIFDLQPPTPVNAGANNTFTDTYDVLGRTFGLSISLRQ